MEASESDNESGLDALGSDAEWLSSLSEPELDFLISLKELVVRRAKTIHHNHLAQKFDLKMLRALGIVLLEHFKGHAIDACNRKVDETLALFYGGGSDTQISPDSVITDNNIQPPTFVLPRRKRLWEGLCEESSSTPKKQKRSEAVSPELKKQKKSGAVSLPRRRREASVRRNRKNAKH